VNTCSANATSVYRGEYLHLSQDDAIGTYSLDKALFRLNGASDYTYTGNSGNSYWYDLDTSGMLGNYSLQCVVNDTNGNVASLNDGIFTVMTTSTTTTTVRETHHHSSDTSDDTEAPETQAPTTKAPATTETPATTQAPATTTAQTSASTSLASASTTLSVATTEPASTTIYATTITPTTEIVATTLATDTTLEGATTLTPTTEYATETTVSSQTTLASGAEGSTDSTSPGSQTTLSQKDRGNRDTGGETVSTTLLPGTRADPVADAGGTYSSTVGSTVLFNGTGSSAPGNNTQFVWDFGDGSSSLGPIVEHVYNLSGTYKATLSLVDDLGNKDQDTRMVYIAPLDVYVDISADPLKDRYQIGDVLSGVNVSVYYSNGSGIHGARVTGRLSGRQNVSLRFKEQAVGKYYASLDYALLNGEEDFIDLYVNASDPLGNSAGSVKKLILVPKETDLRLIVQSPVGRTFAFGQNVEFAVSFDSGGRSMDAGDIVLFEEWTNNKYSFKRSGKNYLLNYTIPEKARSHIPLIIYGTGNMSGKKQSSVKDLGFDLSHDLLIEILSPKKGENLSKSSEILLRIAYPDGTEITDYNISGTVQESGVIFRKLDNLYIGNYSFRLGDSKVYVSVADRFGNGGATKIKISGDELIAQQPLLTEANLTGGAAAIVALSLISVLSFYYIEKRRQKTALQREYEKVMRRIDGLKEVKKSVMQEYYSRKLSEEDTRKAVLDNERELVIEQDKLKQIMRKMGGKYWKEEGEQEVSQWITQELKAGKDPEDLKKQLKEKGMDAGMVDEIGRKLVL
jgi:hypothetical protein